MGQPQLVEPFVVESLVVRQRVVNRRQNRAGRRAWALTALLAAGAVGLGRTAFHLPSHPAASGLLYWVALTAGFAAAEACVAHLTVGRQAHTFAFSEIPFILGLFYFSPAHLVSARLCGTAVALLVVRRQAPTKLAFNLAQYALGSTIAVIVWHAVSGTSASATRTTAAAFAATIAMSVLSGIALSLVLVLVDAKPRPVEALRAVVTGIITAAANTSLALVAINVTRVDWSLLWPVGVIAGFLALAQRSHVQLQKRHDSLQLLNGAFRHLGHELSADAIVTEVLSGAMHVLHGVAAEVELTDEDGVGSTTLRLDGRTEQLYPVPASTRTDPPARARRDRTCLSAPLSAAGRVVGRLTVESNPALRGFGADDQHLLDALAQQAGVALANGQLADELRHQLAENEYHATHDSLTGLANRLMFERATAAMTAADRPAAVLLFDLDRFKDVNDTLGHAAGDALLQDAGARLKAATPDAVCVARLGGDEFAVLLATGDRNVAFGAAQSARLALLQPLDVHSVPVSVDASVGVALAPEHGRDCADLLRHADVAMYAAKDGRGTVKLYDAGIDHNDASRLSLVADLREAIENADLTLAYQPKVSLADAGSYRSVEALVRWTHPSRGFVPPDDFIPVAEQTGVIHQLTDYVLDQALRQCRTWLDEGLDVSVAVNISPRVLRDPTFTDRLAEMLAHRRIPASRLILEITESGVMTDIAHAVEVLWTLRRAGVRLAVDDLGVGHSSLAYLKQLPVHEVKIDKSFVTSMTDDPADDAIVCAIIGLAHRLGLTVVAEGVETELVRDRLAEIDCDVVQGYWYSKPVPAAEIRRFYQRELAGAMSAPRLRVAR